MLLISVLVEFLEEIFVLVFACSGVHLVLHLEHDGDELNTFWICFPEDKVALTSGFADLVVFLEICIRESRHTEAVELVLAVLLKALADHLGRLAGLHVLIVIDLVILELKLVLIVLFEILLLKSTLSLLVVDLALKPDDLGFFFCKDLVLAAYSFSDGKLLL